MDLAKLINVNVIESKLLIAPLEIKKILPAGDQALETVLSGRKIVQDILSGADPRRFAVVGPCSIHDPKAAIEYAKRLKALADRVEDRLFLMMRVYFEKPRTTVGWKGLINDPFLDNSFEIEEGLKIARKLLIEIAAMKLPAATECLDPVTPQYLSELITWSAIGARTVESQTHREMASGLSMPVGFKNGTNGSIQAAIDAIKSAQNSHHFFGIDQEGRTCRFKTRGNSFSHIVLRGGKAPNYTAEAIEGCEKMLEKAGLPKRVVVDCSHGNSNKDHNLQPSVLSDCIKQIAAGNRSIVGFMIESNLEAGNQSIPKNLSELKYGVSVTDPCVDWKTTEAMILEAHKELAKQKK